MAGRVAGTEVREVTVTRRSPAGRAVEMRVETDVAETTFRRFDLRQALEMPEMLFTVARVEGAQGEIEFVFLGRGWGHGVGLCQNGAFGMALSGQTYDQILGTTTRASTSCRPRRVAAAASLDPIGRSRVPARPR